MSGQIEQYDLKKIDQVFEAVRQEDRWYRNINSNHDFMGILEFCLDDFKAAIRRDASLSASHISETSYRLIVSYLYANLNLKFEYIEKAVKEELIRATNLFGPFASGEEAYSVIKEEFEEVWDDVKKDKNPEIELIQLAAMFVRFIVDFNDLELEMRNEDHKDGILGF